jgi:hypothetical protein
MYLLIGLVAGYALRHYQDRLPAAFSALWAFIKARLHKDAPPPAPPPA